MKQMERLMTARWGVKGSPKRWVPWKLLEVGRYEIKQNDRWTLPERKQGRCSRLAPVGESGRRGAVQEIPTHRESCCKRGLSRKNVGEILLGHRIKEVPSAIFFEQTRKVILPSSAAVVKTRETIGWFVITSVYGTETWRSSRKSTACTYAVSPTTELELEL